MKNPKEQSFTDLIKGKTPVLVDFYADWCAPCKMMTPILAQLKSKMGDKIHIIKIDAEKNPAAAIKYQVRGVPALLLFKEGYVLWQQSGVRQAAELEKIINDKLSHFNEMQGA